MDTSKSYLIDSRNEDPEAMRRAACNLATTLFNNLTSYVSTYNRNPSRHSDLETRTIQMKIITVLRGLMPVLQALLDAEALSRPPTPTNKESRHHSEHSLNDKKAWFSYYAFLLQQVRAMQDWWKRYMAGNIHKLRDWSKDATPLYNQRSINRATFGDMIQHIQLIAPPSPPSFQTTFNAPFSDIGNIFSKSNFTYPVAV